MVTGSSCAREPVDWVIVATKAYDVEGASKWLPTLCANGAPVAVAQNGVEHRERFAPYVALTRILPVIVECAVERADDGNVRVRGAAGMRVENTPLGQGEKHGIPTPLNRMAVALLDALQPGAR